ncbi:hypothetical protein LCGC14_2407810, partial [marine sediment metagenome]
MPKGVYPHKPHSERTKQRMRGPRGRMRDRVGRGKYANGYIYVILSWTATKLMEHHVVWVMHHEPIPKGMIVHHKNENKQDNRIENLELMIDGDHRRHHFAQPELGRDRNPAGTENSTGKALRPLAGRGAFPCPKGGEIYGHPSNSQDAHDHGRLRVAERVDRRAVRLPGVSTDARKDAHAASGHNGE